MFLDSELSDLEELDLEDFDLEVEREDLELDESDSDLVLDEASADLDLDESSDPEESEPDEESDELDLPPHFAILYSLRASLFPRHFLSISESGVSPTSPKFYSHLYSLVKY